MEARAEGPQRTCIGCRATGPAADMVRCTAGGSVDRSAPGRGAWVCSPECLETAIRRRAFNKAWKRRVEPEELATLRIAFEAVMTKMRESPRKG